MVMPTGDSFFVCVCLMMVEYTDCFETEQYRHKYWFVSSIVVRSAISMRRSDKTDDAKSRNEANSVVRGKFHFSFCPLHASFVTLPNQVREVESLRGIKRSVGTLFHRPSSRFGWIASVSCSRSFSIIPEPLVGQT